MFCVVKTIDVFAPTIRGAHRTIGATGRYRVKDITQRGARESFCLAKELCDGLLAVRASLTLECDFHGSPRTAVSRRRRYGRKCGARAAQPRKESRRRWFAPTPRPRLR